MCATAASVVPGDTESGVARAAVSTSLAVTRRILSRRSNAATVDSRIFIAALGVGIRAQSCKHDDVATSSVSPSSCG